MRQLIDPSLSLAENQKRLRAAAELKRRQLAQREAQLMAELSLMEKDDNGNNTTEADNVESQQNNDKTTSGFTAGTET